MRYLLRYSFVLLALLSCGEELLPKPDNLISKEKMADIIQEMVIVNAAKTTNSAVFRENNIEPTEYVLAKFKVDSLQYVESDRYYVSKPVEYEKIFRIVEKRLEADAEKMKETKRKNDSARLKIQRDEAKALQDKKKLKAASSRFDSLP